MADEYVTGSSTIGTTEWDLSTNTSFTPDADTTKAAIQLWLDLNALAVGDRFRLKLYEKIASGGTQRQVDQWDFVGVQASPLQALPVMVLLWGWAFTLQKIAGTDRAISWSLRRP
jgi:hypothetical protein